MLIADAATLLYFKTQEEVIAFAKEHHQNWSIDTKAKKIVFADANTTSTSVTTFANGADKIPSGKIIALSFGYAREFERIV